MPSIQLKELFLSLLRVMLSLLSRYRKYLLPTAAVILACLSGYVIINLYVPLRTPETIITIRRGKTTHSIAHKLRQDGIVRSAFWFQVMSRLKGTDRRLKAGRYVFGGNLSLMQSLQRLNAGRVFLLHLTVPEGLSLYKTCRLMEQAGIAPHDSLYTIATDRKVVKRLTGFSAPSLEGFLYPETYAFDIGTSAEQVFAMMSREFFRRLALAGIAVVNKQAFYDSLKLAAIVEREAVREEEKPLIASVFLNRLHKPMRLESCPTVDYLLEQQGIKRQVLTQDDLNLASPYNTYRNDGLTPTPICNPTISSILAVLHPPKTDFLFFFADFEGRNIFSRSFSEHARKRRDYFRHHAKPSNQKSFLRQEVKYG